MTIMIEGGRRPFLRNGMEFPTETPNLSSKAREAPSNPPTAS
jgi:hypothetical protein